MARQLIIADLGHVPIFFCPVARCYYQPDSYRRCGTTIVARCAVCDEAGNTRSSAAYRPGRPGLHIHPAAAQPAGHDDLGARSLLVEVLGSLAQFLRLPWGRGGEGGAQLHKS